MSAQDTSFEALAASPGDYAVDSEWMGDSPPALTVDFIQNSHNHIHHIQQIDRAQKQQSHTFRNFNSALAGGPGSGQPGIGKDRLLAGDPTLTLSQPPTVSSPESLLSSFQDSSSDLSSSKQTSMTALSSLVSGTPAKKSRGRPKGSGRSTITDTSKRSAAGVPKHATQLQQQQQQQQHTAVVEDDIMMADEGLDGGDGDNAQQNWSFRDYLRLDDDQENDEDEHDQSTNTESDSFGTIDPKSIQRTPSFGGGGEQLSEEAAILRAALKAEAGIGSDLSPYSGGPSPLDFVSASSSPTPDDLTIPSFTTPQPFPSSAAIFNANLANGSAQQRRKGHNKAASVSVLSLLPVTSLYGLRAGSVLF